MAREGILPRTLGIVDRRRGTPWLAIVVTTGIAMVLVVSGDLGALADTTVLLLLLVFGAVNVAVLVLRRDQVAHHHFRAPTAIPVIGAVVSLAMLTTKDTETFLRGGSLLLTGATLWVFNWLLHGRHTVSQDTAQIEAVEARDMRP